jgi:hypothetical protein
MLQKEEVVQQVRGEECERDAGGCWLAGVSCGTDGMARNMTDTW